jgi:hypothetical protein
LFGSQASGVAACKASVIQHAAAINNPMEQRFEIIFRLRIDDPARPR